MEDPTNKMLVTSRSIESAYRDYRSGKYSVNRRYQRKLVWTVEEKQNLIDSILKNYPLPIFLVAENSNDGFEIIDGMQRLNAIFSFLENQFDIDGHYFDLDSMSSTKQLVDEKVLKQREPKLSRARSVEITGYEIAQSEYRTSSIDKIEDIFRRINSSGQKLSKQDLRQAGTLSPIADLVREISSTIRTDVSPGTIVPLEKMASISISTSETDRIGIRTDNIFWIQQGILNKSGIRSSSDEQLVLDILADILLSPLQNTGTPVRNGLYNMSEVDEKSDSSATAVNSIITSKEWLNPKYGQGIREDFLDTFHRIETILAHLPLQVRFVRHIGLTGNNPIPRYFEAFFMAVYRLVVTESLEVTDPVLVIDQIAGIANEIRMPGGGGEWKGTEKESAIRNIQQRITHAFKETRNKNATDIHRRFTNTEIQGILSSLTVENHTFDAKTGVLNHDPNAERPKSISTKIVKSYLRTVTAISNSNPIAGGYVIIGIADSEKALSNLENNKYFNTKCVVFRELNIPGVDWEAEILGIGMNEYWSRITDTMYDSHLVADEYVKELFRVSGPAQYEGATIIILRAPSISDPVAFDGDYHVRITDSTRKVQSSDLIKFTRDFDRLLGSR